MSPAEELLKQIEDAKRGMEPVMVNLMQEYGRAAAQAATQFNKAYREATAWQHQRKKPSEGIGGA